MYANTGWLLLTAAGSAGSAGSTWKDVDDCVVMENSSLCYYSIKLRTFNWTEWSSLSSVARSAADIN